MDRKIKQNEAQYDLDRKAAKISALSSENLDKYEHLTGKDLDSKPSVVEKPNFEILHWVELLIEVERWRQKRRACEESKNIEDKNKELPKAINSKTDINQKIDLFDKYLIPEANALIKEIKRLEENFDYDKIFYGW